MPLRALRVSCLALYATLFVLSVAAAEGPWTAVRKVLTPDVPCALADESFKAKACAPETTRAFIATLPDPEITHLGLFFDRNLESLIWAVTDAGYSFAGYWLPWSVEIPDPRGVQRTQTDLDKRQPGVLVFRDQEALLLLFLVGETPTGGLNKEALSNAIRYVDEMPLQRHGDRAVIPIVGPSFSGSMQSLQEILAPYLKPGKHEFRVISGMATAIEPARRIRSQFGPDGPSSYHATVENDSRAAQLFIAHLRNQRWTEPKIAILSESDTVYGQGARALSSAPLQIRFPREISRLRNAYQDVAPATQSGAPQSSEPSVPFVLKGAPGHENVPSAAPLHTPVSQEAILLNIASTLRQEHIEYAGIVATDPLDTVFLCRFLRQACPNIRLFVYDADLLLARATEKAPVEGVLAITEYPLFSANQGWAPADTAKGARTLLSSRYAQGVYNACRMQLLDLKPGLLLEYAPPSWSGLKPDNMPPTWLVALGHGGFWPVAILQRPGETPTNSTLYDSAPAPSTPTSVSRAVFPSAAWLAAFVLLHLFAILYSLFLCSRYDRRFRLGEWLPVPADLFRAYPEAMSPPYWPFVATANASLTAVLYVFISPLIRVNGAWAATLVFVIVSLMTIVFVLMAGFLAYRAALGNAGSAPLARAAGAGASLSTTIIARRALDAAPADAARTRRSITTAAIVAAAASGIFVLFWSWLEWRSDFNAGFLFAYRNLFPGNGVSPAFPVLLLLMSLYYWSSVQMNRVAYTKPSLPEVQLPTEEVNARLACIVHGDWLFFALTLYVVWMILFRPFGTLGTIEHWTYTFFIAALVSAVFFLVIAAWAQFLKVWASFRAVLQAIEKHPLRRAFNYMPRNFVGPLWGEVSSKPNLLIHYRALECLKALRRLDSAIDPDVVSYGKLLDRMTEPVGSQEIDRRYVELRDEANRIANHLIKRLQDTGWNYGMSESLEKALENCPKAALQPGDQQTILAQEFVALRFVSYINRVMRQLRNQLMFVIAGSVLLSFAMLLYPYEARQAIQTEILVTFLVLGSMVGIVFAQMDKDALLSRITQTKANELGKEFVWKLVTAGAIPLLTVFAAQFPAIREYLFSWLEPALRSIR